MSHKKVFYLPTGIPVQLTHLSIVWSSLKEIKQKDLELLTELRTIQLDFNKIQFFEENLFKFNQLLTSISAIWNQIMEIHPTSFQNLNFLAFLDLRQNFCCNEVGKLQQNVTKLLEKLVEICYFNITFVTYEHSGRTVYGIEKHFEESEKNVENISVKNEIFLKIPQKFGKILTFFVIFLIVAACVSYKVYVYLYR